MLVVVVAATVEVTNERASWVAALAGSAISLLSTLSLIWLFQIISQGGAMGSPSRPGRLQKVIVVVLWAVKLPAIALFLYLLVPLGAPILWSGIAGLLSGLMAGMASGLSLAVRKP